MMRQSQHAVVVLGQIGSGKTTLVNKICNSKLQTAAGGESVTRDVMLKHSAYGNGFKVLDTPGFGNDEQRLAHAAAIVAALTEGPVNRILICVKFDKLGTMKESIQRVLLPIKQYKNIITVICTSWDLAEDKQKNKLQIEEKVLKYFGLSSYILSGFTTTGQELCHHIEARLSTTLQTQIIISDTVFQSSFEILEDGQKDFDMLEDIENYTREFQTITILVRKFIFEYDKAKPELDQVMHAITIWIKQLAEDQIREFERKHSKKMDELFHQTGDAMVSYLYQIELKKSIQKQLNELVIEAQSKMRIQPDHPFNKIKKCPHCQTIWLKVEGCDGNTVCGNKPSQGDTEAFLKVKSKQRYLCFYDGVKKFFSILPQDEQQSQTQNIVRPTLAQNVDPNQPKVEITRKGCGNSINWTAIPPLTQQEVNELVNPEILDFLSDKRNQDPEKRIADLYRAQIRKQIDLKRASISKG